MITPSPVHWLVLALGILAPDLAYAQGIASGAAEGVSSGLQAFFGNGCSGAGCAISLVEYLIDRFQLLIIGVGVFVVVRNGFTMIYTSVEDEQARAKKAIAVTLAGVMLAYLSPQFIVAFYTAGGEQGVLANEGSVYAGAAVVTDEVLGIIRWVLTFFVTICLLLVIMTGIAALTSPSDGGERMKKAIISIVAGGLLLISGEAIKAALGISDFAPPGGGNAMILIARGVEIVAGILGIILVVALAVVVYAGIMMILSMGNEEQFGQSKKLIIRAGIGLVIILVSYLLASFLVSLLSG